jgi:hypothetical protein
MTASRIASAMSTVSWASTSNWIAQQLREAFPYEPPVKFLILDHDSKYGAEVPAAIRSMSLRAVRTAVGCPGRMGWQLPPRTPGSCDCDQ